MEGGKKVCLRRFFWLTRGRRKKMHSGASSSTSNKLLPDTLGLRASKNAFKVGSVKFTNSLSSPSIVKKVCTRSKSSKGLKQCRAKVKGVNNPTWIAKYGKQTSQVSAGTSKRPRANQAPVRNIDCHGGSQAWDTRGSAVGVNVIYEACTEFWVQEAKSELGKCRTDLKNNNCCLCM